MNQEYVAQIYAMCPLTLHEQVKTYYLVLSHKKGNYHYTGLRFVFSGCLKSCLKLYQFSTTKISTEFV